MITPIEYNSQLKQIENLDSFSRPTTIAKEPVFDVDLNTREIKVPAQFKNLAVYSDHNAETIWFVTNRYYDGIDLYGSKKRIAMQYVNALGEEGLDVLDFYDKYSAQGVYGSDKDKRIGENEILIAWQLDYSVTKASGPVQFALRFFEVQYDDAEKENTLSYNLTTRPATVNILNGLYITENAASPVLPKTKIEDLIDRIEEVYSQANIGLFNWNNIVAETIPTIDGIRIDKIETSENFKNINYNQLNDIPTINGGIFTGEMTSRNLILTTNENNEITDISIGIDVDSAFDTESKNPVENKVVANKINSIDTRLGTIDTNISGLNGDLSSVLGRVSNLESLFGELTFVPIEIDYFIVTPSIKEKGDIVYSAAFNWDFNVENPPKKLSINGQSVKDMTLKEYTIEYEDGITDTKTYLLRAEDAFENVATKEVSLDFVNGIYFNSAPIPAEYNSDFIKSLTQRVLSTKKAMNLEFDVADGEYMYICTPEENGNYTFKTGGFDGGFGGAPVATVDFTNEYGHTETYRIYKSDNTNLAHVRVELS